MNLQKIVKNAESEAELSAQLRLAQRGNKPLADAHIHNAWVMSRAYQADAPTKAEGDAIEAAYKASFKAEWEKITK